MAAKAEMQQKRDENVPPEDLRSEGARSQLPRPAGASAFPFRQLNNSPQSSYRVTGKDRLRQFCRHVFRGTASSPPLPRGQENPQVASADCTKPKPAGHFHTGQASSNAAAASECPVQHRQPSGIPKATTGRPRTYKAGGDYRVLHSTPNVSPGLQASLTAAGSHETDGTTDSADTSTSSGICCVHPSLVPDMLSPDFDKFRELLHQDRIECYGRDFIQSPVFAVGDLSPALTPPLAVPLPASNSVHNGRQIVAVPLPDSPAHYTDSPKQLEGSPTAEFQLPASVVWKRRRHSWHRSSATPPRVLPGDRIRHAEESPRQEERDSSDGGGVSGSSTSRGDSSPEVIASGFRTPDIDNFCRRIRAEIAESYSIFPRLSPAESVESVGTDVAKHRSKSPLLSPANSIKAAVEVQDSATTPSPVPSPPPLLAWARTGPTVRLAARHRLSTVLECSREISYSTFCGTTALGPVLEESLLMDARQPTLVDATFGACMSATMASELVENAEELPADCMSDSLASFIEHERMIMEEFGINDSS